MLNKIFTTMIFLVASINLLAQQKPVEKKKQCGCSFSSINQIGLLAGEKSEAFQVQTINGLRYNTWMVGAGVGIDGYRYRSIPLFLHGQKDFSLKSSIFFLYSDIGLNYPWLRTEEKVSWTESDFDHGIYYDGGIGYKVPIKRQAIVFSTGFSLKELKENRSSVTCPFFGPCQAQNDVYSYSLRRWSLKVGIQL